MATRSTPHCAALHAGYVAGGLPEDGNGLDWAHYETVIQTTRCQMYAERCITEDEVEHAIADDTAIESYPNDTPYPSVLLLGHAGTKAIHAVYADDVEESVRIIITVYEPDTEIWCDDLKTRR